MIFYFHISLCQKDKIKSLNKATDKKVKCISLKMQKKSVSATYAEFLLSLSLKHFFNHQSSVTERGGHPLNI